MSFSRSTSPHRPPTAIRNSSRTGFGSRAPSRPRASRNSSRASLAYLPQGGESLLLPDGPIGEEATELLQEFVHPHRSAGHVLADDREDAAAEDDSASDAASVEQRKKLPWYRRPSPLWFLIMVPFAASATAATLAPKVEIYTQLACDAHKPEYRSDNGTLATFTFGSDNSTQLCASDPVVGAAVARMNMIMTGTLGVLTCLTTAWWGSLSDRYGRIRVLSFSVFGLLMTDFNFLVVAHFHKILPGGYWFLLVGPFLDGLLGGMSAVTAAIHAYVADCTEPGERAHVFSLFLGLMFTGFGLGPTLGGLIIHFTGSVLSVFYLATATHLFYAALVIFVIPESLSARRMAEARQRRQEQLAAAAAAPKPHRVAAWARSVFGFLSPLQIFHPVRVDAKTGALAKKKDWNLFLVAMAFGCTISVMGAYPYKFQYTSLRFGWTSEQIGYWLSVVGATRALFLTVLLPLIIKLVKSRLAPAVQLPVSPNEPLQPSSAPAKPAASRSLAFDFALARISLGVEVLSYAAIPFAPGAGAYTAFTMLGAFGSGFSPAVQSVALGLYTLRGGTESGRLFGAMSVVQSLCSQVLGPALYGLTYMNTVRTFPAAIFFVTSASITLAFALLALVRIPPEAASAADVEGAIALPADGEDADARAVPAIVVEDVGKAASPAASPAL